MACMSSDDEHKIKEYGDSLQLTNWILDSGATCHMTPEVTEFIPGSLEDTDKFIEVADRHHVTEKKKYQYEYKCAMIMKRNPSQSYITYSSYH